MIARLAPVATVLRVAAGLLTIIGAYLPWATFVLNDGPYPEKSTLNYFVDPLGVTGFRFHLLVLGLAIIVVTVLKVAPTGRIVRG
ncbi:MAG: branched-chain amino acid transport system permease protein, partial [Pseudonocardiales bacterium]|nr:branched-chain amino acid transport system permease protein [Pseudonocardiales bacterium]